MYSIRIGHEVSRDSHQTLSIYSISCVHSNHTLTLLLNCHESSPNICPSNQSKDLSRWGRLGGRFHMVYWLWKLKIFVPMFWYWLTWCQIQIWGAFIKMKTYLIIPFLFYINMTLYNLTSYKETHCLTIFLYSCSFS